MGAGGKRYVLSGPGGSGSFAQSRVKDPPREGGGSMQSQTFSTRSVLGKIPN